MANAPERLDELQDQASLIQAPTPLEGLNDLPLETLENAVSDERTTLATLQLVREDRTRRLNELLNKNRSDASELSEAEKRLADLGANAPTASTNETLTNVETLWRDASAARLDAQIDLLRLRQGNIDLLTELASRENDVAGASLEAAQQEQAQQVDMRVQLLGLGIPPKVFDVLQILICRRCRCRGGQIGELPLQFG